MLAIHNGEIIKNFAQARGFVSLMHVPRLVKICLNVGLGSAKQDEKLLSSVVNDLSLIAGQKAVITYAKQSIASFKLRKGFPVGCRVTLRGLIADSFMKRIFVALVNEREFKGFSVKSFGDVGNLSFGIKEHTSFPEIDYNKVYKTFGINVIVVTTAKDAVSARSFLSECYNLPFYD